MVYLLLIKSSPFWDLTWDASIQVLHTLQDHWLYFRFEESPFLSDLYNFHCTSLIINLWNVTLFGTLVRWGANIWHASSWPSSISWETDHWLPDPWKIHQGHPQSHWKPHSSGIRSVHHNSHQFFKDDSDRASNAQSLWAWTHELTWRCIYIDLLKRYKKFKSATNMLVSFLTWHPSLTLPPESISLDKDSTVECDALQPVFIITSCFTRKANHWWWFKTLSNNFIIKISAGSWL